MAADLLITARYKPDVLLVPNRALQTIGNRQYVTVLDGDTQRNQEVTTGLTNNDSAEIVDDGSLRAGQVVVVR